MYIVTIRNGGTNTEIHNSVEKLLNGKITKGINTIDSFQFTMFPSNVGFNLIFDYTTLVTVYDTNKGRYEFYGRVLYSNDEMTDSGLITKEVICESYFGFLCDSQQEYAEEQNWTVRGLLNRIISAHNAQVESHKRFAIGEVTVTDPNDNLYCGIQRENTWEALKSKLLDTLGGEFRFRIEGDGMYLDYLTEIGEEKQTEIALSRNMKSVVKEKDPSDIVTRLIPLGCKLTVTDGEGNKTETEYRLDIKDVNDGKNYIDDEAAQAVYGIRVATVEFDDITLASTLLKRGKEWLADNNRIRISYTVTALDLSLIGLDVSDFDVCNYYPLKNPLLGINDTARVIKKSIDICDETKSTIEFGDNFENLSSAIRRQSNAIHSVAGGLATKQELANYVYQTEIYITESEQTLRLEASEVYGGYDERLKTVEAELGEKIGRSETAQIVRMINESADVITLNSNRLVINSDNFKLLADGTVTAMAGHIAEYEIVSDGLKRYVETESHSYTSHLRDTSIYFKTEVNSTGGEFWSMLRPSGLAVGSSGDTSGVITLITANYNGNHYSINLNTNTNQIEVVAQ